MKSILAIFIILVLVFVGCQRVEVWRRVAFWYPNWTPDGKIVCWQSNALVKEWEYVFYPGNGSEVIDWDWTIIEMNQDGSNMRQVAKIDKESGWIGPNFGEVTGHPCISCAGDKIVFSLWDFSGDWSLELIGIFVVNRDGAGLKKIVHKGTYPDLSPDGKRVVYEKPGEGIWIINVDGTGDHQITNDPADGMPSWSHSGNKIVFCRNEQKLILCDTSGANQQILWDTSPDNYVLYPDWSWDDKMIIIGGANIYFFEGDSIKSFYGIGFDKFSPDGTMFVGQYNGIWTVKIDGTDKKEVIQNISRQERQGWEIW